jgi:hypothetical protein
MRQRNSFTQPLTFNMISNSHDTNDVTHQPIKPREPVPLDLVCNHGHRGKYPFRLKLHFDAVAQLMNDALHGLRIYELMKIQRPGDVWHYVWVEVLEAPPRVERFDELRRSFFGAPNSFVPFLTFDRLFRYAYDDTEPEDECWILARGQKYFPELADELFASVRQVQAAIQADPDLLTAHVLDAMAACRHPKDYLAAPPVYCTKPGYVSRYFPKHPPGYYSKLEDLLSLREVNSVGFGRDDDYIAIRIACTEQRRRVAISGRSPEETFFITMSSDGLDYADEWEAEGRYYSEGIGRAYLFLVSPDTFRSCLGMPRRRFPLFLVDADAGEIEDYGKTQGDGWFLYTRKSPYEYQPGWLPVRIPI